MWLIGFILHEMAFGLLSIFLPLYITKTAGGTLIDFGIMTALAAFLAIPFSFFWGYMSDRVKRYRLFILASFSSIAVLIYVFSLTVNITLMILIFGVITIAHVAHESPKNVLIAENYSSQDWEKNFAWYELATEIGWLFGLGLGFLMSSQGFDSTLTLSVCALLNLAAFASSAIFVEDPPIMFERGLAGMERSLNFMQRGITLALKATDGQTTKERYRAESPSAFCVGLILFSLATSMMFTPLPIFFSQTLALESNIIFAIFIMNSGAGCIGYLIATRASSQGNKTRTIKTTTLVRGGLPFLLATATFHMSTATTLIATAVLVLMGFAYALFLTSTLSISMEILQEGKAGLFNSLIGLGGAVGCLAGPILAASLGFLHLFVVSSVVFIASYLAFSIFGQ